VEKPHLDPRRGRAAEVVADHEAHSCDRCALVARSGPWAASGGDGGRGGHPAGMIHRWLTRDYRLISIVLRGTTQKCQRTYRHTYQSCSNIICKDGSKEIGATSGEAGACR
jgi:hypothetical protein